MTIQRKLCWTACGFFMFIGIPFFVNEKALSQGEGKTVILTQNKSIVLQEANQLYLQARKTGNDSLIYQAIDKLSVWFDKNKNNPNKKLVAEILRTRGNNFIVINEMSKGINDYKESMKYEPIAQMQVVICSLEEEQGSLANPQECYAKAVDIFKKNKIPTNNVDFLIARIQSGDKSAIIDYKNAYQASTGKERKVYEMMAEGFFDKTTYKAMIGQECHNCNFVQ